MSSYFELNGKMVYANDKTVGIDPDGRVYEGHDGPFQPLDTEDKIALAKLMIERWQKYLLAAQEINHNESHKQA